MQTVGNKEHFEKLKKQLKELIDEVNPNYIVNEDGYYYFEKEKVAIALYEKYSVSSINVPKKYLSEIHYKYEDQGIRLIQLLDWHIDTMWYKIKSLLENAIGNTPRIYARQCEIRKISNKEAKEFNDKLHIQNHRHAKVTYGLFYNNQLMQLMSFSQVKWNRNIKADNQYEIVRGCMGSIWKVYGGVSKLYKHFIREYKPACIFSYCDSSLFNGVSYIACGMKYAGNTGETKYWLVDTEDGVGDLIPRNPSRYRELKELSGGRTLWTPGSNRYVEEFIPGVYQGKGKEYLQQDDEV